MFFLRRYFYAGYFLLGLLCSSNLYAEEIHVQTQYGTVTVKDELKRVVTVYEGALDSSFALGIEPVGAISTRGGEGVASYIQRTAKNVPLVGSMREINIEAIVAQRPDIILAPWYLSKEKYNLLSKIAPTIVPVEKGIRPDAWIEELRLYAKALNRESKAEEVIQQVNIRIDSIRETVQQHIPENERGVSLIRWMPQGAMVLTTEFFSNVILAKTGFEVTDANLVKEGRPHSSALSLENLSVIDNDWLFMATLNAEAQDALAAAQVSPAFSRLSVAKKDRVIPVHGQLWTSATGPIAVGAILDDIQNVIDTKLK
ncbi:iron-siderophore ABC transporter substrate-binding protein [Marinomonas sp. C2222]|uniref:Iron-siderophore ABC transporter substrate-binding protein n=1 Tax=Marinomonas sargassi TaxID=2984494 RepID=A0ABT2YNL5_9GAMM|nr:iron-siderophore ABC transporter substrate-binding protein [Marinomonas sargassi]MCV2401477.1 iron-siderophore ABC transporter substrate-binding protein [Marinomonas sargassi]